MAFDLIAFRDRFRELCALGGVNERAALGAAGVDPSSLSDSKILKPGRRGFSNYTLERLATALRCTVNDLLTPVGTPLGTLPPPRAAADCSPRLALITSISAQLLAMSAEQTRLLQHILDVAREGETATANDVPAPPAADATPSE